ncbi:MAG TPA: hypothetical protein DCG47_13600 [Spirochaetaceae bacterium]|nr:hypothetical protein [Spirochaetaceae bacterium]
MSENNKPPQDVVGGGQEAAGYRKFTIVNPGSQEESSPLDWWDQMANAGSAPTPEPEAATAAPAPEPIEEPRAPSPELPVKCEPPVTELLADRAIHLQKVAALQIRPDRPPTQNGLALAIGDAFSRRIGYVYQIAMWRLWDGRRWPDDHKGQMVQVAQMTLEALATDNPHHKRSAFASLERAPAINGALSLAATDPRLVMDAAIFDADPTILNTPGGIVNIKALSIGPHRADAFCTHLAGATPDFEADAPVYERFMLSISDDRPELAAWLEALIGYALLGVKNLQIFVFLVGSGGNGKSVLLALILAIFGSYACTVSADVLLDHQNSSRGGPAPELLDLIGRRFVCASETDEGARLNLGRIKAISGGDQIVCRAMRSNIMHKFVAQFLLVLATNAPPRIGRVDNATKRRFRMMPFDRVFEGPERDDNILTKLLEEKEAILGRWVKAAHAVLKSGQLPPCKIIDQTGGDFLTEEDPITRWIGECAVLEPGATTPAGDLYRSFTAWQEREGTKTWSMHAFGRSLTEHGCAARKMGIVYREGLRLL